MGVADAGGRLSANAGQLTELGRRGAVQQALGDGGPGLSEVTQMRNRFSSIVFISGGSLS
jgi:hypothetical protein